MQAIELEEQFDPEPVDAETLASLGEADAAYERGEFVTLEQAQINIKKRYAEWQKAAR